MINEFGKLQCDKCGAAGPGGRDLVEMLLWGTEFGWTYFTDNLHGCISVRNFCPQCREAAEAWYQALCDGPSSDTNALNQSTVPHLPSTRQRGLEMVCFPDRGQHKITMSGSHRASRQAPKQVTTEKLKYVPANASLIGIGLLAFEPCERINDRYGAIWLKQPDHKASIPIDPWYNGKKGTLIAEVLQAWESPRMGDFFRGLSPRTPSTGDIVVLGSGSTFTINQIGVKPDDRRETDWLNPQALFDIQESLVRLHWIPA